MISKLRSWLDVRITVKELDGTERVMSQAERLAELVGVNGSMAVRGWGTIVTGGAWGRQGLDQDEAMELISDCGFLSGVKFVDPKSFEELIGEVKKLIHAKQVEHARQVQLAEKIPTGIKDTDDEDTVETPALGTEIPS